MRHGDFTLRLYSVGGAVRMLQELLGIPVTGIYDEATESRVRAVQRRSGLPVTGVCDDATWAAVRSPRPKPAPRQKPRPKKADE